MQSKNRSITIVACLIVMFSVGIVYLWSVFLNPVVEYYQWDAKAARMTASIMIFMFIFGTMIGGFIQDKLSPKFVILLGGALFFTGLFTTSLLTSKTPGLIYISYGMVAGCGVGFAYAGSLNCMQKWFPHRRGFASGLSVCAFGLSSVVFAPLSKWLLVLPAFGANAVPLTFRTLAIIFTILIVAAGFFVRNPDAQYISSLKLPTKISNVRQFRPKEAVKTAPFWLLVLVIFFLPVPFMIANPLVKTIASFRNISEPQYDLTIALSGIVQAVSRLLCGVVSDKIGRAKTVLILAVISLAASVMVIFAGGFFYTIVIWMIFFVYAGPSSIYPAMTTDVYGTKHSGGNYGIALIFLGISSPVFTQASAWLSPNGFETGDFTMSFILAAAVGIIPLVALPLFDVYRKRLQSGNKLS